PKEHAMPDAVTHPSGQELAAFGLGKLAEPDAAAVAAHLEVCSGCRQAVAGLPADSFLGKVRATRPGVSDTRLPPAAPARPAVPSTPPQNPLPNLPPELANHPKFRIVRELGRGGMGIVYEAVQTLMDRTVALKVINPSVLDHPEALARFHAE